MCGVSGFWSRGQIQRTDLDAVGMAMAATLAHRGPDAEGLWSDPEHGIVLSHSRLAVLDQSSEGAQPMQSNSGRYIMSYNGEIYNHLELRDHLRREQPDGVWRGHSDTETLLAAIEAWGIEEAIRQAVGMMAVALWDRKSQSLVLARDRTGEKPLLYARTSHGLAFCSESSALRLAPGFSAKFNSKALRAYFTYGYVPEPWSIYAGVKKLEPSGILRFAGPDQEPTCDSREIYFSEVIRRSNEVRETHGTFDRQSRHMEETIAEVVASQTISDVSVGCFLSGGIDSTLVAALMQRAFDRPVMSFSIGFEEMEYDESAHAAAVARHLRLDHEEIRLREEDALSQVFELSSIFDEPFSNSAQIPTALLCREARKRVTVALTGEGGDEVFGGYNRYTVGPKALRMATSLPSGVKSMIAPTARLVHRMGGSTNKLFQVAVVNAGLPVSTLNKISRLGEALGRAESIEELHLELMSIKPNGSLLRSDFVPEHLELTTPEIFEELSPVEWMMAVDSIRSLPGDLLVRVDRASMAVSLETRAPYLDRRVVDAAWQLPIESKVRGSVGKVILRDILARHVPSELFDRPKQGFGVPLDKWLRRGLNDWASILLSRERLEATGLFEVEEVRSCWTSHLEGKNNHGKTLWNILMFMAWFERNPIDASDADLAA